jgi:hypothetical protein
MSRLPLIFILTGMIGFILYQASSLLTLTGWVGHELRGPTGWFHVHLFVLGWATMLAMGAVYQLIPVIVQKSMYNERLGYFHYASFTIGLCGLLYGFIAGHIYWIALCAAAAFIGIVIFGWNVGVTLWRASQWNAITLSAACSIAYLILTGLSGMLMGINFAAGWWVEGHDRLLGTHIWLGTIGWFGLLITGFSYKMLPMFYLAHHYSTKPQTAVLLLWNGSVLLGAIAFLAGASAWLIMIALLLLTAAVAVYNAHLLLIRRSRHKRNPGSGIKWSVYCSIALGVSLLTWLTFGTIAPSRLLHSDSVRVAGWLYLSGWVSFTILSYASKIVPFLWWTHRYGKQAGKPGTPLMADMLNDKHVRIGLGAIASSTLLVALGLLSGSQQLIELAETALSLSSLVYISLVALVFAR